MVGVGSSNDLSSSIDERDSSTGSSSNNGGNSGGGGNSSSPSSSSSHEHMFRTRSHEHLSTTLNLPDEIIVDTLSILDLGNGHAHGHSRNHNHNHNHNGSKHNHHQQDSSMFSAKDTILADEDDVDISEAKQKRMFVCGRVFIVLYIALLAILHPLGYVYFIQCMHHTRLYTTRHMYMLPRSSSDGN
jgi:hypothetical protein